MWKPELKTILLEEYRQNGRYNQVKILIPLHQSRCETNVFFSTCSIKMGQTWFQGSCVNKLISVPTYLRHCISVGHFSTCYNDDRRQASLFLDWILDYVSRHFQEFEWLHDTKSGCSVSTSGFMSFISGAFFPLIQHWSAPDSVHGNNRKQPLQLYKHFLSSHY